ncbi:hypothetical protein Bca4012_098846 [Brassica carinata]
MKMTYWERNLRRWKMWNVLQNHHHAQLLGWIAQELGPRGVVQEVEFLWACKAQRQGY